MLGKIEGKRRGKQRIRWLDIITEARDMSLSKLQRWQRTGKPGALHPRGLQRVGHHLAIEQQHRYSCRLYQVPWREAKSMHWQRPGWFTQRIKNDISMEAERMP